MKPVSDINTPDMSAFWMPFTANQQFKAAPRILKSVEGMYYHSEDGRKILDGTAGLWCCNAGHGRREIARRSPSRSPTSAFTPHLPDGSPLPFELANRLVEITPRASATSSIPTRIGVRRHGAQDRPGLAAGAGGQGTRTRLIGRERSYHGVGFGGISVGAFPATASGSAPC